MFDGRGRARTHTYTPLTTVLVVVVGVVDVVVVLTSFWHTRPYGGVRFSAKQRQHSGDYVTRAHTQIYIHTHTHARAGAHTDAIQDAAAEDTHRVL